MKKCYKHKNINNRDCDMSDIIIHSPFLNYYLKHVSLIVQKINVSNTHINHPPRRIHFFIDPNNLQQTTGRQINRFVYQLIKHKIRFAIYPPPPCLFSGKFPKILRDKFYKPVLKLPLMFLNEGFIKYVFSKEDKLCINNKAAKIFSECINCKYKRIKICRGIFKISGSWKCFEKLYEWINQELNNKQRVNLLDVGCGFNQGYFSLYNNLSNKGANLYLLDPDESIIKILKERMRGKLNTYFIQDTIENIVLENKKFDIILLSETYYHLQNIKKAFNNIRNLLKNDGILIIKNIEDPEGLKHENGDKFHRHFRHDNLCKIISTLKKYKFIIMEVFTDKIAIDQLSALIKVKK